MKLNDGSTYSVAAETGESITLDITDSEGDNAVIELSYDEANTLIHKLTLATELAGKPSPLGELYRIFTGPRPVA